MVGVKTLTPALPRGFRCSKCDKWHSFPVWVFAHWDDALQHTCDRCETVHDLKAGRATRTSVT